MTAANAAVPHAASSSSVQAVVWQGLPVSCTQETLNDPQSFIKAPLLPYITGYTYFGPYNMCFDLCLQHVHGASKRVSLKAQQVPDMVFVSVWHTGKYICLGLPFMV
jgi:hypothetical protein